jgi:hypothetical protein
MCRATAAATGTARPWHGSRSRPHHAPHGAGQVSGGARVHQPMLVGGSAQRAVHQAQTAYKLRSRQLELANQHAPPCGNGRVCRHVHPAPSPAHNDAVISPLPQAQRPRGPHPHQTPAPVSAAQPSAFQPTSISPTLRGSQLITCTVSACWMVGKTGGKQPKNNQGTVKSSQSLKHKRSRCPGEQLEAERCVYVSC